MHAETSMFSRTVEANPDPVADTGPMRIWGLTIETVLKKLGIVNISIGTFEIHQKKFKDFASQKF